MNMHYVVVIYKYFILEYSVIFTVVIPVRGRELYLCLPLEKITLLVWNDVSVKAQNRAAIF